MPASIDDIPTQRRKAAGNPGPDMAALAAMVDLHLSLPRPQMRALAEVLNRLPIGGADEASAVLALSMALAEAGFEEAAVFA